MGCERFRTAISARLDGEDPGLDTRLLAAHLDGCSPCRTFEARAGDLHRQARVGTAEPVPDLTAPVLAAATAELRRVRSATAARWALGGVAVLQLLLALPVLLLADVDRPVHVARELAAFDVALAGGLLAAALRPSRAVGLLPMMLTLAGALLGVVALDLTTGSADLAQEAHHLLPLVGVVMLWQLARDVGATAVATA